MKVKYLILLTFIVAFTSGLWIAASNVKYRDFKFIAPFIVQAGLYQVTCNSDSLEIGIFIRDVRQNILGLLSSAAEGFNKIKNGIQELNVELPSISLMPGGYTLGIWIVSHGQVDDAIENAIDIDIISDNIDGRYVNFGRFKHYGQLIRSKWNTTNN